MIKRICSCDFYGRPNMNPKALITEEEALAIMKIGYWK